MTSSPLQKKRVNTPRQVLFASLVGTAVEFFDFYIYATAAVLVFPRLFFPATDPASSVLASLATFAIAFVARPIGSALFGHFGDRIGRKRTLVLALSTMGISTFVIGTLPSYEASGWRRRYCWLFADSGRGSGWAVNGAVRFCWLSRMLRRESVHCMECFRNWALRWGSCSRAEFLFCFRGA